MEVFYDHVKEGANLTLSNAYRFGSGALAGTSIGMLIEGDFKRAIVAGVVALALGIGASSRYKKAGVSAEPDPVSFKHTMGYTHVPFKDGSELVMHTFELDKGDDVKYTGIYREGTLEAVASNLSGSEDGRVIDFWTDGSITQREFAAYLSIAGVNIERSYGALILGGNITENREVYDEMLMTARAFQEVVDSLKEGKAEFLNEMPMPLPTKLRGPYGLFHTEPEE
jgi:hypothetical protein